MNAILIFHPKKKTKPTKTNVDNPRSTIFTKIAEIGNITLGILILVISELFAIKLLVAADIALLVNIHGTNAANKNRG